MTRITGVGCADGKSGLGCVYDGPVMQKGTVHMIDSVCFCFSSDVPCSGDFLFSLAANRFNQVHYVCAAIRGNERRCACVCPSEM